MRSRIGQSIIATHSVEIVNEAEIDEIVSVKKGARRGTRISDADGLQATLSGLGSRQNVYLTRLAQGKRVLFVEGADVKLLRRFARRVGLMHLGGEASYVGFPLGGVGNASRVEFVVWTFSNVLRSDIAVAAMFDRDYKSQEQVQEFLVKLRKAAPLTFVLGRKELENYLLIPQALARLISRMLRDRTGLAGKASLDEENVLDVLRAITEPMKNRVYSLVAAARLESSAHSGIDQSTILRETGEWFDGQWTDIRRRLEVVPGKETLSELNAHLQSVYKISITPARIVEEIRKEEVPGEFMGTLTELEKFAAG